MCDMERTCSTLGTMHNNIVRTLHLLVDRHVRERFCNPCFPVVRRQHATLEVEVVGMHLDETESGIKYSHGAHVLTPLVTSRSG